jgi:hypothetical protein
MTVVNKVNTSTCLILGFDIGLIVCGFGCSFFNELPVIMHSIHRLCGLRRPCEEVWSDFVQRF